MKIGDLRHRATIENKTITIDELKQQTETWSEFAQCWAAINPLSGREYFAAKQVNAEIVAKITIRYRSGVTAQMRVVLQAKMYEIVAVINPEERNVFLELLCKEAVV